LNIDCVTRAHAFLDYPASLRVTKLIPDFLVKYVMRIERNEGFGNKDEANQ